MRNIDAVIGQELMWVQPDSLKHEYELCTADDLVATLRWVKTGGSLANAESANGKWTFKRAGFLKPRVLVRRAGSVSDIATFEASPNGNGFLDFSHGERFRWADTNLWRTEWKWSSLDGTHLVGFKLQSDPAAVRASVDVQPGMAADLELPLLTLLGWYLIVLCSYRFIEPASLWTQAD